MTRPAGPARARGFVALLLGGMRFRFPGFGFRVSCPGLWVYIPTTVEGVGGRARAGGGFRDQGFKLREERIFIELMTSDRKLKASREGSK